MGDIVVDETESEIKLEPKSVYAIDLDGVLADFVLEFTSVANRMFNTPVISTHSQVTWDFVDVLTAEQRELTWAEVDKSRDFWMGVKPLATWPEMELLHSLQHDEQSQLYFVTARNVGIDIKKQTEVWLQSNGFCGGDVILSDGDKGKVVRDLGITVAIDDRQQHCEEYVKAGVPHVYLMRRQYNRDWHHDKVTQVGCMIEFCWHEYKRREAEFAERGIVDGEPRGGSGTGDTDGSEG